MIRTALLSFAFAILLVLAIPASAQTDSGSKIISAVECMQASDYEQADKILRDIISRDKKSDAAWYYLGMNFIAQNDPDMAEECFRAAVSLDPSNFWYRSRLAALYEATSRIELTIETYEKLLEDFPQKSDLYFDLVRLYAAHGDYEKALGTIDEIEKVFGMTESIAIYRFNLLVQLKKEQEAYQSLEDYNSKFSSPYVLSVLADQLLSEYNDSLAVKYYDEALELAPDYTPALIGKAEALRLTRKYDDYFDLLEDFVSMPDAPAESKSNYISEMFKRLTPEFILRFQSRFDAVMQKSMDAHQRDSSILNLVGVYQYSTGRKDQACEVFKKNAELYPESLSANASYTEILMYAQKWEELSKEGREAYERFPKEVAFLELAIIADGNLDRNDEVVSLCDQILEQFSSDTSAVIRALTIKGDLYYEQQEPKKAFKAYEAALKYNPDDIYVLNNYAYYLCEEGQKLKKACEMSRKTVEAKPDDATYLDTYGWILFKMGKPEEAVKHLKRAMLYGGKDSAVIMDHYADVLFALKEYARAMVYWNKALLIDDGKIEGLAEKVEMRKRQINNEK